jgi:hypothetical protein
LLAVALAVLAPVPQASHAATADAPADPTDVVTQVAVAGDATHGALVGVLAGGTAYVKEGSLSASYVLEMSGVTQIAVASDPVDGPLVAVLAGGTMYAQEGSLSAPFVSEKTGVTQIAVASDATNGALLGAVDTGGTAWAKEGGLSAGWVSEFAGATQVAVASDTTNGPLIGVLDTGGTAWAKDGGLSTGWVDEFPSVNQIAVASDARNGPLIGVVTASGGTAKVKEGGLSANWVDEYPNVGWVGLGSDTGNGPLIGVVAGSRDSTDIDGNAHVKQGGLGDGNPWTAESPGVNAPPNLSGGFIIEDTGSGGSLLCAQQGTGAVVLSALTADINPYCLWQQSGPDNDAVLYNPAVNLVLDVNSGSTLADGTPTNMQPYYTNPTQSYEQWNWAGETGFSGAALQPVDDTTLNLDGDDMALSDWDTANGGPASPDLTWTKVGVSNGSYPPVTMSANPTPPPGLLGDMLIQDTGTAGFVLCADPGTSGTEVLPLTQSIDPYCLWQVGGPSDAPENAYLYNPAVDKVLDVNSGSDLAAGEVTNLQPYYTNPEQTYEQWQWSGETGYGGQALSPVDDTDLNLDAAATSSPFLPLTDWENSPVAETWTTIPVSSVATGSALPVAIEYGAQPGQYLCAGSSGAATLGGSSADPSCQWSQVVEAGGAFAYLNTQQNAYLTYNAGTTSPVTVTAGGGTGPSSALQWWTLGGMQSSGAQDVRPYTDATQNIDGAGCGGACVGTATASSREGFSPGSLTWTIIPL